MIKTKRFYAGVIGVMLLFQTAVFAEPVLPSGKVIKGVSAEGACAVVGMTAEQCRLMALQRARVAAIEKAAGVTILSDTVVTNFRMAADVIRSYSRGLIVNESPPDWSLGSMDQKDKSLPPIPEYRVKIQADVYTSEKKIKPIGLSAELNNTVFRNGEKARITIKTVRSARIAIFNITADDKVVMVFPNDFEKKTTLTDNSSLVFPSPNSEAELEMQTLPGHERDTEAFFVIAADGSLGKDPATYFPTSGAMGLSDFFRKYATVADYCEDSIVPYEVTEK